MSSKELLTISFMSGPQDGRMQSWPIEDDHDLKLNFGRREGCDVLLDYDSQVSRVHAHVIYSPSSGNLYVEDANSRNGTFVGPDRIQGRVRLQYGQLFRVGRTWLCVDKREKSELTQYVDSDIY